MNVRLSAISLSTLPLDWDGNLRRILTSLQEASRLGAQIVVLPELCLSGYGCEDAFLAPWVADRALVSLRELASCIPPGMAVVAGLPLRLRGAVHNAAALVTHGQVHGAVCKRHLAREGIHYEPRWFVPWTAGKQVHPRSLGFPVGDLLFDWDGLRIGIEICEDAWAADRPGLALAAGECDLILSPSASHFALGKDLLRERLVLEGSRSLGVGYAYANLQGNEAGRIVYDGNCRIACFGEPLARGPMLSFADHGLATADIDIDTLRMRRSAAAHPMPLRPPELVRLGLPMPEFAATKLPVAPASAIGDPFEDFGRATALAIWDYLRKSHSKGFVLSLSGGADSATCAVLVHLACHWALRERADHLAADLPFLPSPPQGGWTATALTRQLLTCAYQSTRNSGTVTLDAARTVAHGVGAEFVEWDVDALVQGYLDLSQKALGRVLSWDRDDLALQNIQARVRAPSVWLWANATGKLLLSTSNRSEMAVGYATMDGDTAGGLSPLAGIDKPFLLRWLAHLETCGIGEIRPLTFLSVITAQAPTAELRPKVDGQAEQTDEADLMPYDLLTELEILAIRERRSPQQCLDALRANNAWASQAPRLEEWIQRFFRLWSRNQWKRERYAPSFHLDGHNLDPRSWCRFPILSAGYEQELTRLK